MRKWGERTILGTNGPSMPKYCSLKRLKLCDKGMRLARSLASRRQKMPECRVGARSK